MFLTFLYSLFWTFLMWFSFSTFPRTKFVINWHLCSFLVVDIRYRGEGKVCFLPPLFCPTKFLKSSDQCFGKKARRRRKNFEVPFFKKLTFLGKFNGFKRFFSGFQCLHDEKSPPQAKNLGTPFFARRRRAKNFPTKFSFWSDTPPEKIWR